MFQINCQTSYDASSDVLTVKTVNSPVLAGDTKVLFQTNASDVPRNYEKCPFYFWFNTSFLEDGKGDGKPIVLSLGREDLDNPHKPKTWHCFRQGFRVDVELERLA